MKAPGNYSTQQSRSLVFYKKLLSAASRSWRRFPDSVLLPHVFWISTCFDFRAWILAEARGLSNWWTGGWSTWKSSRMRGSWPAVGYVCTWVYGRQNLTNLSDQNHPEFIALVQESDRGRRAVSRKNKSWFRNSASVDTRISNRWQVGSTSAADQPRRSQFTKTRWGEWCGGNQTDSSVDQSGHGCQCFCSGSISELVVYVARSWVYGCWQFVEWDARALVLVSKGSS